MHRGGHERFEVHRANRRDAGGIARVHVDTWRTTYRRILRPGFLDSLSYEQREDQWGSALQTPDGRHYFVAREAEGPVIAFAAGGPERTGRSTFPGELYALYVLEPYQRHRLGSSLLVALADALVGSGINAMVAWVLAQNPATRFYEAMGGARGEERTVTIAGDPLDEVAYGWTDLTDQIVRPRKTTISGVGKT